MNKLNTILAAFDNDTERDIIITEEDIILLFDEIKRLNDKIISDEININDDSYKSNIDNTDAYDEIVRCYECIEHFQEKLGLKMTVFGEYAQFMEGQGKYDDAINKFTSNLARYRKLAETDSERYLPHIAISLFYLADFQKTINRYDESEKNFIESFDIIQKLEEIDPERYLYNATAALASLAELYEDTNRFKEAMETGGKLLAVSRKLAGLNPEKHLITVAETLTFLSEIQKKVNQFNEAETNTAEAVKIYQEAAKLDGRAIKGVPEQLRTAEMYLTALKQNVEIDFCKMPDELKTAEICLEAVKKDSLLDYILEYVPENLKTAEICLEAVKQDGWSIEYVPENLKTAGICFEAVKQCGYALQYVPENLKTPELCLEAVKENGVALQYVPKKIITPEICLEAVKQDSWSIKYVPENLRTAEICLIAVKQDGSLLGSVPENLKTAELCLEAVKQDIAALKMVPENFKTTELYFEAVKQNGMALEHVPENQKTAELCLEAVKQTGIALKYAPGRFKTNKLCLEAFKQNADAFEFIPDELKTAEVCNEAMKQNPCTFWNIPDVFKNEDLCLKAVQHDITMFFCVPSEYRTKRIYIEVINNNGWVLQKLLQKYLNDPQFINVIRNITSKFKPQPLEFLRFIDVITLTELVRKEPYETGALILACIEPYKAVYILKKLPNNIQVDLIRCVAAINIKQTILCEAELKQKLSYSDDDDLIQFLMLSEGACEEQIIESLKAEAPEAAKEFTKYILFFDEILLLSDKYIKKVLREINSQELAKALKTAASEVQDMVFRNLSRRAASMLNEDMEYMGPIRLKDVKESQRNILTVVRKLLDCGEITFNRPAETARLKFSSVKTTIKNVILGGVDSIIKILNLLDRDTEDNIMNTLSKEALAEEIRKKIFIFKDIVLLNDRDIQKIMRELDSRELAIALTSADAEVQNKLFINMSKKSASLLKEEMECLGPVSLKAIEKARIRILSIKRNLEKTGEISVEQWIID